MGGHGHPDQDKEEWLRDVNRHPRDARLRFDEGPHVYHIDGCSENVSVTTLVHRYFEKFDADRVIAKMMGSRNWPQSKYYGMTAGAIKRQWAEAGADASTRGTRMHKSIELFYNGQDTTGYEGEEFDRFLQFHAEHEHLKAYRTEWEIFDEDLKIAGSVDMVFRDTTTQEFLIYDWKRSKEIKFCNPWAKGLPPLDGRDDCNFVSYSLQLNIYRYILETRYGLTIGGLFLVVIHPNTEGYLKIECLDLRSEVDAIVKQIRSSRAPACDACDSAGGSTPTRDSSRST